MASLALQKSFDLLNTEGIAINSGMLSKLDRYVDLIRKWNDYASLVSIGDLEKLLDTHVPDSLSLAKIVQSRAIPGQLLDIGSGGGFPVIPLKIVLPELSAVLVERSTKKVGFLRKVVGALGLTGVDIINGEFPVGVPEGGYGIITARAVEKPERVHCMIYDFMDEGAVFLCQSPELGAETPKTFHVEQIDDIWSREGLRRGSLRVISREGQ